MRIAISPSAIIATIAVVCACGGSAWAGASISGAQIRDSSLSGADVRNGSISARDLAPSARMSARHLTPHVREASALGAGPVRVMCADGEVATGGGGAAPGLWRSEPVADASGIARGWIIEGDLPAAAAPSTSGAPGAHADTVTSAHVICTAS